MLKSKAARLEVQLSAFLSEDLNLKIEYKYLILSLTCSLGYGGN
jgi:hypothetical protein